MKTKLAAVFDWLHAHPWVIVAFCGGALAGVLICLPVIPWELPDSSANVIGAALGALIAVWGAAWVSLRKERESTLMAAKALEATMTPVLSRAERMLAHLGSMTFEDKDSIRHAYAFSQELHMAVAAAADRLKFMAPVFLGLGGPGVIAFGSVQDGNEGVRFSMHREWGSMYEDPNAFDSERSLAASQLQHQMNLVLRGIEVLRR
jgi:hypothetical protein